MNSHTCYCLIYFIILIHSYTLTLLKYITVSYFQLTLVKPPYARKIANWFKGIQWKNIHLSEITGLIGKYIDITNTSKIQYWINNYCEKVTILYGIYLVYIYKLRLRVPHIMAGHNTDINLILDVIWPWGTKQHLGSHNVLPAWLQPDLESISPLEDDIGLETVVIFRDIRVDFKIP